MRVEQVPLLDLARAQVLGEAGGVEPDAPPGGPRGPSTGRVVAVGDVEVVLEQLAVADVDRLGDHVRVRVLRDRGVEQARVVLPVDVLLDGAAGAADADGVERDAMVLDEVLLQHQGGLAAELEVVVRVRAQARRVDDGVALAEHRLEQHGAGARRALVVADGDAALQAEHQPAVPERVVGGRARLGRRREHRDAVHEAVDRAPLPADDVGNGRARRGSSWSRHPRAGSSGRRASGSCRPVDL